MVKPGAGSPADRVSLDGPRPVPAPLDHLVGRAQRLAAPLTGTRNVPARPAGGSLPSSPPAASRRATA